MNERDLATWERLQRRAMALGLTLHHYRKADAWVVTLGAPQKPCSRCMCDTPDELFGEAAAMLDDHEAGGAAATRG